MSNQGITGSGSRAFLAELRGHRMQVYAGGLVLLLVRSAGRAVGLGVLLAAADLIWVPDSETRASLLALTVLIWAVLLGVGVIRVLRLPLSGVAAKIDRSLKNIRRPVLSGYELTLRAERSEEDSTGGMGEFLREMQLREARDEMRRLAALDLWPLRRIGRSLLLAAAAVILLGIAGTLWHEPFVTTALRLLFPARDIPPYSKVVFKVSPGDCDLLYGSGTNLVVELGDAGSGAAVWLLTRSGGRQRSSACFGLEHNTYGQNLEKVVVPLEYCFKSGRARSHWYSVNLRLQPRIEGVELMIAPPEYSGLGVRRIKPADEPVEVLAGSNLKLFVESNRPLSRGSMRITPLDGVTPPAYVEGSSQGTRLVCFEWQVRVAAKLEAWVYDLQGNGSYKPLELLQSIVPDLPPEVTLFAPEAYSLATPDAVLTVEGEVSDDLGIDQVDLVKGLIGFRDRGERVQSASDPRRMLVREELDLGRAGVAPGQTLEFFIEAFDTNPSLDGFNASRIARVRIITHESYALMLREQTRIEDFIARYRMIEQHLKEFNEALEALEKTAGQSDMALRSEAIAKARGVAGRSALLFKQLAEDFVIYEAEKELKLDLLDAATELEFVADELSRTQPEDQDLPERVARIRARLKGPEQRLTEKIEEAENIARVMELLTLAQSFDRMVGDQRFLVRNLERIKSESVVQNRARLLQSAREQQEILNGLNELCQMILAQAERLPGGYDVLSADAVKFVNRLRESEVAASMQNCEVAGRNGRAVEAHREAVKALELLEKLLEEMLKDQNCFAAAAAGMVGDCIGGGECERVTLQQMLEAAKNKNGSGTGQGGSGAGLDSDAAQGGGGQGGNTPRNVPVHGPRRTQPGSRKSGSGEGSGENGGGQRARMSDESERMVPGQADKAGGRRLPVEQVPRLYQEAVRNYFEGEGQ